ncbi:N-acyl-phosphatidylethanolamine-hydrolyzing phospholipase D [Fusarium oxysporum f. sp. albedinis]|nr:N-acyl-phosphatidylethanolamine-hydrolyzing phospholipase D [Fusarium oxysporum f. sp. albedinis]
MPNLWALTLSCPDSSWSRPTPCVKYPSITKPKNQSATYLHYRGFESPSKPTSSLRRFKCHPGEPQAGISPVYGTKIIP